MEVVEILLTPTWHLSRSNKTQVQGESQGRDARINDCTNMSKDRETSRDNLVHYRRGAHFLGQPLFKATTKNVPQESKRKRASNRVKENKVWCVVILTKIFLLFILFFYINLTYNLRASGPLMMATHPVLDLNKNIQIHIQTSKHYFFLL